MYFIPKSAILLSLSFTILFSQCTSQEKAQMILNDYNQQYINKICSDKYKQKNRTNKNQNFYISVSLTQHQGLSSYETYYDYENTNVNDEFDLDTLGYSFSLGYIVNENSRIEISKTESTITESKESYEYSSESTLSSIDLNYIWVFNAPSSLDPYLLVGVSYNSLSSQLLKDLYDSSAKSIGVGVMSEIGINYSISNGLEAGVGLNIKYTFYKEQYIDYLEYTDRVNLNTYLVGLSVSLRAKF